MILLCIPTVRGGSVPCHFPTYFLSQQTNIYKVGTIGKCIYNITLSPQNKQIDTIRRDDSITAKDTGGIVAINFVITLEIEEFDPVLTEIGNPAAWYRVQEPDSHDSSQRQSVMKSK
jgi:hypothetical protein